MKRNKLLSAIMCVSLFMTALGCSSEKASESGEGTKSVVRIAGMTGPTSIGMVGLMEDDENGKCANDYEFTIAGSADEITPKLIQGELDMAAVPANLASVLYNKTEGKMRLLAVNTLGVLYIVEDGETIKSVEDLKGKTIYATGKGSTPEYTLSYILEKNGISADSDVNIEWKSEPAEIVSVMEAEDGVIAMLPQPYITVASSKIAGLRTALDLGSEWEALGAGKLITGVVVARAEFVDANRDAVNAFLDEYKKSCGYAVENIDEAAGLVEKFGIFKAAVAVAAIPYCNISFIEGSEMKTAVSAYYDILAGFNIDSIGGAMPADDYFYIR